MNRTIFVDESVYMRIMKAAVERDGSVIIDSRGHRPFEIKVDTTFAQKELDEVIDGIRKGLGVDRKDAERFLDECLDDPFIGRTI